MSSSNPTIAGFTSTSHEDTKYIQEDPRISMLQAKVAALKKELGPDQDPNAIVARHIKLLHTYNETKDTSQMLIAIYAQMTQKTITQMHTELGLPLSE